jgi:hypothetical protein
MSITINADDLRTIRALEIAAEADQWLTCHTDDGAPAYRIRSQSHPDRTYLVTASLCDCPDFVRAVEHRASEPRPCKHILAVRLFNELVRAERHLSRRRMSAR